MLGQSGIQGDFKGVPYLTWRVSKHASSSFTGDVDDTHGDQESASATPTYTIWTVTGAILVRAIWGICNTSLTGAAGTLSLGVTGSVAAFSPAITGTDIDGGDVISCHSSAASNAAITPIQGGGAGGVGDVSFFALDYGVDILETTGTANIDTGQIDYFMVWAPAEAGATVVESGAVSA